MDFLMNVLSRDTFCEDDGPSDVEPLDTAPGSFITKLFQELELLPIEITNIKTICTKIPGDTEEFRKNSEGEVEALSFEQLILYITSVEEPDKKLIDVFIKTFISFTSARLIFAALIARYYTNPFSEYSNIKDTNAQNIIRGRVLDFLIKWIVEAGTEIPVQVLNSIENFNNSVSPANSTGNVSRKNDALRLSIKFVKDQMKTPIRNMSELHTDDIVGMKSTIPLFMATNIRDLAEQMTLQNSNIFRNVKSNDIVLVICGKLEAKQSPTFLDLQEHFDKLSRFVAFSIIYDMNIDVRVNVYRMWVKLLFVFRELNDYAALFAVVMGLTHVSVKRLTKTLTEAWKGLSKEDRTKFEELESLTNITNNFNNYRSQLEVTKRPCIPFIGCFQKDWVYYQEMRKKEKSDKLINISSINKCHECLMSVHKYQHDTYPIKEDEKIQKLLYNLPEVPDSIKLMNISMLQEITK
jgi:hypothetical protein